MEGRSDKLQILGGLLLEVEFAQPAPSPAPALGGVGDLLTVSGTRLRSPKPMLKVSTKSLKVVDFIEPLCVRGLGFSASRH